MRERPVGVDVVRLPEGAAVGGDRDAPELDLVPDHPRGHGDQREDRDRDGRDPAALRARRRTARGSRAAPGGGRWRGSRRPRRGRAQRPARRSGGRSSSKRQPEQRGSEQLVEDLTVAVDVVPDEVGLQRRDHRGRSGRCARSGSRLPVSKMTIEVATATRICTVPTDHQWKPAIQKIGIRNQP